MTVCCHFIEAHKLPMLRILTNRENEYCDNAEQKLTAHRPIASVSASI